MKSPFYIGAGTFNFVLGMGLVFHHINNPTSFGYLAGALNVGIGLYNIMNGVERLG